MPIPTAATIVQEFLSLISDGRRHDAKDVQEKLRELFGITPEEAARRIPSGGETVLSNRFRNAKFAMRKRSLARFEETGNGVMITEQGQQRLVAGPRAISCASTVEM